MQVTTEQIDPCQLALTITVAPDRVAVARQKAMNQAAQSLQIPGFRKGKVPPHLAKGFLDPVKLQQRAAEIVVPDAYQEAVGETSIEPWADPQFELMEMSEGGALIFKAIVPLRPQITLGPYKGLALEKRNLQIRDTDIDKEIEQVRERFAEFPEVERPVETGDVILCELQATVEGAELPDLAEARATAIEVGKNIPDFDAGLVGMVKDEAKTITAVYPETFEGEALRGKTGTFNVKLTEIRARVLPEFNDELVQKAHRTAKTAEELRETIKESLEKAAVEMSDNELEFNLIGKIVEYSTIYFPPVLLNAEMQQEANQLAQRLEENKVTFDSYLQNTGKTREQWQAELAESATMRIKNSLVLSEVARSEKIEVLDEDVDAKINERAEQLQSSPAAVRALAESQETMDRFRDLALTEKILNFLKTSSKITERSVTSDEIDAENVDAPAEAPKKAPAKKSAKAKPAEEAETAPAEEAPESIEASVEAPKAPAKRARKKTESEG